MNKLLSNPLLEKDIDVITVEDIDQYAALLPLEHQLFECKRGDSINDYQKNSRIISGFLNLDPQLVGDRTLKYLIGLEERDHVFFPQWFKISASTVNQLKDKLCRMGDIHLKILKKAPHESIAIFQIIPTAEGTPCAALDGYAYIRRHNGATEIMKEEDRKQFLEARNSLDRTLDEQRIKIYEPLFRYISDGLYILKRDNGFSGGARNGTLGEKVLKLLPSLHGTIAWVDTEIELKTAVEDLPTRFNQLNATERKLTQEIEQIFTKWSSPSDTRSIRDFRSTFQHFIFHATLPESQLYSWQKYLKQFPQLQTEDQTPATLWTVFRQGFIQLPTYNLCRKLRNE